MLRVRANGMKYVVRVKLTTGTRLLNAALHSLATADFAARCQDRYISRRKIGTPCEKLICRRKKNKQKNLRFIGSCTNYPTVVTVKQEFIKMEPTCNFFRNLKISCQRREA